MSDTVARNESTYVLTWSNLKRAIKAVKIALAQRIIIQKSIDKVPDIAFSKQYWNHRNRCCYKGYFQSNCLPLIKDTCLVWDVCGWATDWISTHFLDNVLAINHDLLRAILDPVRTTKYFKFRLCISIYLVFNQPARIGSEDRVRDLSLKIFGDEIWKRRARKDPTQAEVIGRWNKN